MVRAQDFELALLRQLLFAYWVILHSNCLQRLLAGGMSCSCTQVSWMLARCRVIAGMGVGSCVGYLSMEVSAYGTASLDLKYKKGIGKW